MRGGSVAFPYTTHDGEFGRLVVFGGKNHKWIRMYTTIEMAIKRKMLPTPSIEVSAQDDTTRGRCKWRSWCAAAPPSDRQCALCRHGEYRLSMSGLYNAQPVQA